MIKTIRRIVFVFFIFCSLNVFSQTTKDSSLFSVDTALNKVIYFHNDKTMFLIDDVVRVKDDYFLSHYYNTIFIPNGSFFQQLSTSGSACQDIVYKNKSIFDYEFQPNTYSPYIFTPNNVKYFQNKKAYTSINYSNSLNGGQYFKVDFAKNIYKGLNLQTQYDVNYADGDFSYSQVMNQFFNVTLNYITPKGRYRVGGGFIHNRAYILESGGITSDSLFIHSLFDKPENYPTNYTNAYSKWKSSEFVFNEAFRIHNDTNANSVNVFNLGALVHNFSYGKYARLYKDDDKAQLDSLATNIIRNSLFWTNDIYSKDKAKYFFPVSFGVNYDVVKYVDSLNSQTNNVFSPEMKAGLRLNKLKVDFSYSHSFSSSSYYDNDKQMNIKAAFSEDTTNDFSLYANLVLQDKAPDYIFSHYRVEHISWDCNVRKTNTKSLSFGIDLIKAINIEVCYFSLKDVYRLDKQFYFPEYAAANLWQIKLNDDFKIKDFGFKGMYVFQNSDNDDAVRLPKLLLKQSIYYEFSMFKHRLLTQVGVDMNYFTKYYADFYNTKTGMFERQHEEKIGNYLYTDLFINIKISRFSLFLAFIHPYAGMFNKDYFNTPLYPHEGFTFRYGISWKFLD